MGSCAWFVVWRRPSRKIDGLDLQIQRPSGDDHCPQIGFIVAQCSESRSGDGEVSDSDCIISGSKNLRSERTNGEGNHLHGAGEDLHKGNGRACEHLSSGAGENGKSTDGEGRDGGSENLHGEGTDGENNNLQSAGDGLHGEGNDLENQGGEGEHSESTDGKGDSKHLHRAGEGLHSVGEPDDFAASSDEAEGGQSEEESDLVEEFLSMTLWNRT